MVFGIYWTNALSFSSLPSACCHFSHLVYHFTSKTCNSHWTQGCNYWFSLISVPPHCSLSAPQLPACCWWESQPAFSKCVHTLETVHNSNLPLNFKNTSQTVKNRCMYRIKSDDSDINYWCKRKRMKFSVQTCTLVLLWLCASTVDHKKHGYLN